MNIYKHPDKQNWCWHISCKKWDTCKDRLETSLMGCTKWNEVFRQQPLRAPVRNGAGCYWTTHANNQFAYISTSDGVGWYATSGVNDIRPLRISPDPTDNPSTDED